MVDLVVSSHSAEFWHEGVCVGTYVLDDPYKPYLHPIRTPAGHAVSLAMPHDHRHHKGLMYALATPEVNFWEEIGDETYPVTGRQLQRDVEFDFDTTRPLVRQLLTWATDDGCVLFEEEREVGCTVQGPHAIRWYWRTHLRSLTDTVLRQSPWSEPATDGRKINYHGLGLRFPRSFGGMSSKTQAFASGAPVAFEDALGANPDRMGIVGEIDGQWSPPLVSVTIGQLTSEDAFFILRDPFSYLSVGPSNAAPVEIRAGDVIDAEYSVLVEDIVAEHTPSN